MTLTLILEQAFNGLQAGVTLFLVAAGLTLILGIMDVVFFGAWRAGDDWRLCGSSDHRGDR